MSGEEDSVWDWGDFSSSSNFGINESNYISNATNSSSETPSYSLGPLPWWRQIIWSFLFGAMVLVATVGNLVVIWIVLAHKRMRTVTNYLLVNLSIADLMVSTLNVIPNYIFMSTQHWPFGALYCKIVQFVAVLSISASTLSLMAIAMDRYTAIMNPLKPRMGRKVTLGIAGVIWTVGIVLSSPHMIFFTTFEHESGSVICYGEWPDGSMTESFHEYLYNLFFMLFTYFVPIAVMGYTYTRVGLELWGSQSIGEASQRQLENIRSKRRVVKMMIVVVCIFAICWFPFQLYFIIVSLVPQITSYAAVQEIYLGIYWLAMSNSMYNPIIYCWMNARFRRGFQQVFFWCPFVNYVESECGGGVAHNLINDVRRVEQVTRYSVSCSPDMNNRIVRNAGSSTVHIPLHVLTSDGKRVVKNSSNGENNAQNLSVPSLSSKNNGGSQKSNLCINKSHQHD